MMNRVNRLIIGTRASKLALWQAHSIHQLLEGYWPGLECHLETFVTKGDQVMDQPLPKIGGKGLFTAELENALHNGQIDLAVHSLKDLPIGDPAADGLTIGAICERVDVRDVLIARDGQTLAALPSGACIGTSSLRRQAQLLAHRPDLKIMSIRGNIDTRMRKVREGTYDAVVLAAAGIIRLGLAAQIDDWLPLAIMLPAPGQGALAVQCRQGNTAVLDLLAPIHHPHTHACVTAERAFLNCLGEGCSLPVAAYATMENEGLRLSGLVAAIDGKRMIHVAGYGRDAQQLGAALAQEAIAGGAKELLA